LILAALAQSCENSGNEGWRKAVLGKNRVLYELLNYQDDMHSSFLYAFATIYQLNEKDDHVIRTFFSNSLLLPKTRSRLVQVYQTMLHSSQYEKEREKLFNSNVHTYLLENFHEYREAVQEATKVSSERSLKSKNSGISGREKNLKSKNSGIAGKAKKGFLN
jgi:hypothetical protein